MKHWFAKGLCIVVGYAGLGAVAWEANAQKLTGKGGLIPDDGKIGIYNLQATGLPSVIDTSFGLERVCVNIAHTWDDDLNIYLVSPNGAVAELARRNGDGDDNFTNCCFANDAEVGIDEGVAPFTGSYRPKISLGGINNGQNPNGVWKLVVVDVQPYEEAGRVISWSLTFGNNPARAFPFRASNLPILIVNCQGMPILDEPKTKVRYAIIDNGGASTNRISDAPKQSGFAAIEVRGRSSQRHPKLSMGVELLDSAGEKGRSAAILGLPKEKDFVLTANHSDKSLLRNYMAYMLFEKMGHYAPRSTFVELVIDGEYRGVYQFGEKIKRGQSRVDIDRLDRDDESGDSLTGGYIFKTDWDQGANNGGWTSKYTPIGGSELQTFLFHYPEADDITLRQQEYIHSYVDSFELAIDSGWTDRRHGYPRFIDMQSFVDVMLMVELGRNVDGYWVSSYYYKDRMSKGGKLHAGPIWDYDLAFGNFEYYQGYSPAGWHWETYSTTSEHLPAFWVFLAKDPSFQNQLKCRWLELRATTLSLKEIYATIDAAAVLLDEAQQRNFELWPIMGKYVWPNPKPYSATYRAEIARLKDWFLLRIAWMDAHMPGTCD